MQISDLIKKITQPTYVTIAVLVIYTIIKVYTIYTPTTADDKWADNFKDKAQALLNVPAA